MTRKSPTPPKKRSTARRQRAVGFPGRSLAFRRARSPRLCLRVRFNPDRRGIQTPRLAQRPGRSRPCRSICRKLEGRWPETRRQSPSEATGLRDCPNHPGKQSAGEHALRRDATQSFRFTTAPTNAGLTRTRNPLHCEDASQWLRNGHGPKLSHSLRAPRVWRDGRNSEPISGAVRRRSEAPDHPRRTMDYSDVLGPLHEEGDFHVDLVERELAVIPHLGG
jgi:hypothetical protein